MANERPPPAPTVWKHVAPHGRFTSPHGHLYVATGTARPTVLQYQRAAEGERTERVFVCTDRPSLRGVILVGNRFTRNVTAFLYRGRHGHL